MSADLKFKRRLFAVLRVAITAFALLLLFRLYKPSEVAKLVADIGVPAFVTAMFLYLLCILIGAWKWRIVIGNVPYRTLLQAVVASCFYSILPSGQIGGELSKILIVKSSHTDADSVVASVIFDKVTGVLGLLLIGLAAFALSSHGMPMWETYLVGVLAAGCVFCLFAAPLLETINHRLRIGNARLRRLQRIFGNALHSVARFSRDRSLLVRSIAWGVLSQGTILLTYLVIAAALKIEVAAVDIASTVVLANLAALLPISVGGFGVREAGLTAILANEYGVPGEQSLALSLTAMSVFLLASVAGAILEFRRLLPAPRSAD